MPIGWALAICFIAAVLGLAGLSWVALVLLHHPKLPAGSSISLHDLVSVLQLVFASVAGAGALVALVMTYRRQRVAEVTTSHDRTRVLNERFTTIAAQLGDNNPAVRLAGIHAMAGLADDWEENRQTCVDVLCAYLRLPDEPDPGNDAPADERLTFRANQQVRHTAVRLISAHLRPNAATSWQGLDLDFAGVRFDGGDFRGVVFSGGTVNFSGAQFSGELVDFRYAVFSGATVDFTRARFSGDRVDISGAVFSGGTVKFWAAEFTAKAVYFSGAQFWGATVYFDFSRFPEGQVWFVQAEFSAGAVGFRFARFSGGSVDFFGALFTGGVVDFASAVFSGGTVGFRAAVFSDGTVSFGGRPGALFSGSEVTFAGARFCGGTVLFEDAQFSGGTVSFEGAELSGGKVSFNRAQLVGNTVRFEGLDSSSNAVSFEGAEFFDSEDDITGGSDWEIPPWFDGQQMPLEVPDHPHYLTTFTEDPESDELLPRRRWQAALARSLAAGPWRRRYARTPPAAPEDPPVTAQPEAD